MGFDAMFFGRHEGQEDGKRMQNQEEEWIQMPSTNSFGSHYQILFSKSVTGYAPPP
jgi:hypothetical protein